MEKKEKILVPVHAMLRSDKALKKAREYAEERSAEMYLLHIIDLRLLDVVVTRYGFMDRENELYEAMEENLIKSQQDFAEKYLEEIKSQEGNINVNLRKGDPAKEIVKYAEEIGATIIIMERLRKEATRLMFGSVLDEVLKTAPCHVLVLK